MWYYLTADSTGIEGNEQKDEAVVSADNADIRGENEDLEKVKNGQGWR